MSLSALLAAGRTICGMKTGKTPFAMREESLLPQFNPGHAGQFASTVLPQRPQNDPGDARNTSAGAEFSDLSPQPNQSRNPMPTKHQAAPDQGRPAAVSKEPPRSPNQRPAPGVLGRLLSLWTGGSQSRRPLVQAEFDLSKVQVVRNDLSESDLELIPSTNGVAQPALRPERDKEVSAQPAISGRWTNFASLLPSIRRG